MLVHHNNKLTPLHRIVSFHIPLVFASPADALGDISDEVWKGVILIKLEQL